jgi:dTDP-4-dehydrorhamnose 3,5-epimerase
VKAKLLQANIPDVKIIQLQVFKDDRGFFTETFNEQDFKQLNLPTRFVQDNHSQSVKHVLRGFHYQGLKAPQGKLVRCTRGRILDVAVDIRVGSPTYGQCVAQELSEENMIQMYIPAGFGHAFLTLSNRADVQYKCTHLYSPESEGNILWNDSDIGFDWGVDDPIVSPRDSQAQTLAEYSQDPAFTFSA